MAARTILDNLLQQSDFHADNVFRPCIVGTFIFWDMMCSVLVSPSEQRPLNTPEIYTAVASLRGQYCTIISHAIELVYYLGCLGRYCRAFTELGTRDANYEIYLENQLLEWEDSADSEPLKTLNESFRLHGLVMLNRLCRRCTRESDEDFIRTCAIGIIHNVSQIRTDGPLFKFVVIPLMSAGAELTELDEEMRSQVLDWFGILSSICRHQTNQWATELLRELWSRNDAGMQLTWLQLMLQKDWALMLG